MPPVHAHAEQAECSFPTSRAARLSQAAEWHFWRSCTVCCRRSRGGGGGGQTMITAGTTAPGLDSKTLGNSWQLGG